MYYAISDIHGNKQAWDSMLQLINLKADDKLIVLGDVIDRNDYGIEILQQIIRTPNMYMIPGNHEYMMMQAYGWIDLPDGLTHDEVVNNWLDVNGGWPTMQAFDQLSIEEQKEIEDYLKKIPLNYHTVINGVKFDLCHACPSKLYSLIQDKTQVSKIEFCTWDREWIRWWESHNTTGSICICGHTPTLDMQNCMPAKIYHKGCVYDIDCGAAYMGKWPASRLACIRLDDMQSYYVAEGGTTEVVPSKCPMPYVKGVKAQPFGYSYDRTDLDAILARDNYENPSEPMPSLVMKLKAGILSYFKEHPEKLRGTEGFEDASDSDIRDWADEVEEDTLKAYKAISEKKYAEMKLRMNLR